MLERLLVLVAVVVIIYAMLLALRLWQHVRLRRLSAGTPLEAIVSPGRPAVVAFTTPTCVECRTRQKPALSRLATLADGTATIEVVCALDHPTLVDQLGILTVPATVVVDSRGRVRRINLGFADEHQLFAQLQAMDICTFKEQSDAAF